MRTVRTDIIPCTLQTLYHQRIELCGKSSALCACLVQYDRRLPAGAAQRPHRRLGPRAGLPATRSLVVHRNRGVAYLISTPRPSRWIYTLLAGPHVCGLNTQRHQPRSLPVAPTLSLRAATWAAQRVSAVTAPALGGLGCLPCLSTLSGCARAGQGAGLLHVSAVHVSPYIAWDCLPYQLE